MSVIAIQKKIIDLITAEAVTGGKLSSVELIGKTAYPGALNKYPFIGVEVLHRAEDPATNATMHTTIQFAISVAAHSDNSIEDAYAQRQLLLDDGNGNGLEPLLRSLTTASIGNGVYQAYIREVRYSSSLDDGRKVNDTEWLAMSVVRFEVMASINY